MSGRGSLRSIPYSPAAMVAAKARYGLASAPGTRFSTRRLFGLEQVVVLDVGAGDREVVVVLRPRRLVRLGEQVELELGAQERLEAERPRPLDLALQDPAGRLLLRLAVLGVDIAEHERRLLEPGDPPQRAEVRDRVEVAVAGGPAGETVAGLRVHLDVAPEQVGAGVHPPARDLVEEVVGRVTRFPISRPSMSGIAVRTVSISPRSTSCVSSSSASIPRTSAISPSGSPRFYALDDRGRERNGGPERSGSARRSLAREQLP
jgi:hypothetical protein